MFSTLYSWSNEPWLGEMCSVVVQDTFTLAPRHRKTLRQYEFSAQRRPYLPWGKVQCNYTPVPPCFCKYCFSGINIWAFVILAAILKLVFLVGWRKALTFCLELVVWRTGLRQVSVQVQLKEILIRTYRVRLSRLLLFSSSITTPTDWLKIHCSRATLSSKQK